MPSEPGVGRAQEASAEGPGARTLSVVVPAHDEADVIERCLASLHEGAQEHRLQVVVVCNGCSDDTAEIARRAAPHAVVVETDIPSKAAALNLGDDVAEHFPRCYVDADVVVSPRALDRVADVLTGGTVLAAAPRPAFDLSRSGPGARRFLQLWQHAPYFTDDLVGSGFYAVSEPGHARLGPFPPVVADDYYVASSFAPGERRGVDGCTFTPLLPVTLRGLIRIHVRHYAAHRELAAWLAASPAGSAPRLAQPTRGGWMRPFVRRPGWWPSIAVYVAVKAVARLGGEYKHRYGTMSWNRDQAGRDSIARAQDASPAERRG